MFNRKTNAALPNTPSKPQKAAAPQGAAPSGSNRGLSRGAMHLAERLWQSTSYIKTNIYLLRALITSGILNIVMVLVLIVVITRPVAHTYFATTPTGELIPLVPLSQPIMTDAALAQWTVQSVTKAFTLTWSDYRQNEAEALPAFTVAGQEDYMDGLREYKIINLITTQGENMSSVATGAPEILQRGVESSANMFWVLQFPMVWTYSAGGNSENGTSNNPVIVKAVVVRVPQTQSPSGLAINQILVANQ